MEIGKYVSLNWAPGKIKMRGLARVCPTRKLKFGPKPGLTGQEAKRKETDPEKTKWAYHTLEPTDSEQRLLIGAALEIAIETSFTNHVCTNEASLKQTVCYSRELQQIRL